MDDVLTELAYGYVQGRYLLAVGDGPDEGRLPDGRPATGMTITFTPATVMHHLATPPTTVLRTPTPCEIGPDGYVREKDAADGTTSDEAEGGPLPGVWLIAGIYRVTFGGLSSHSLPKAFDVEVTPAHTEASPLWLTTAEPYIPPPGMVVQTVALPPLTVDGDVLTIAAGEVAWSAPTGGDGGGAVDSVNGQTGTVILDAADVGALPDDYTPPAPDLSGYATTEALTTVADSVPTTPGDIGAQPAGDYAATTHDHDGTYQPVGDYAAGTHTHPVTDVTGLQTALDGKADDAHTHDERYYTEAEVDTALSGKADDAHTHDAADLTASGTADSTTFLRGDNTWATPAGGGGGGGASTAALTPLWYPEYMGDAANAHTLGAATNIAAVQAIPVPEDMTIDALVITTTNGISSYYSRWALWDASGTVLADSGRVNTNAASAWTAVLPSPLVLPAGLYLAAVTCSTTSQNFVGRPYPWVRTTADPANPRWPWVSWDTTAAAPTLDPATWSTATTFVPAYVLLRSA